MGKTETDMQYIGFDHERALAKPAVCDFDENKLDRSSCDPAMHTMNRNVEGRIKWLQSRT